jgi:glucose-1-phosphate adenylyltransferase
MQRPPARASSGRYVSRLTGGTLAVIMAGGRGERLHDLTAQRCKPATPFGGKFRIIDFVLSNCVNSGIRQISILTQYKAQSLNQHVQHGWSYLRGEFGEFVEVVPAQQQLGPSWYRGTADAVFQNLELIVSHHPKHVLVLAGDHIYKMDYGPMIAYHVEKGADITVGVVEVPARESRNFGVLTATEWNRVTRFAEKPAEPDTLPGRPDSILASMGIYVFNSHLLGALLSEDAADAHSAHDFGKNVLPAAIAGNRQVFAYPFQDVKTRAQSYWRDVGTIDAYYEANMDLVSVTPIFNLYDKSWPLRTWQQQYPPVKTVFADPERMGAALDSIVSGGCILSGGRVIRSVLGYDVRVNSFSEVENSIIFNHVNIGRHSRIRNAVIDRHVVLPEHTEIGYDLEADRSRYHVSEKGVIIVVREESMLEEPE